MQTTLLVRYASLARVATQPRPNGRAAFVAARGLFTVAAQIAFLWAIDLGASALVAWLHAPLPGNVVGLAMLFALLCGGIVKVEWFAPAATLLVKHLAFFFIPITVGLLGMGALFASHGVGIMLALAVSAAIGIATCGLTSQRLLNARVAEAPKPGVQS